MRLFGGLRPWVIQRLSAIYAGVFIIALAVSLLVNRPVGYATWHAWLAQPFAKLTFLLFFTALFFHAWIGVRDVLLDYVHKVPLQLLLLALLALGLLALEGWVVLILAQLT